MDYQITCVCGKSFLVSDKQIAAGPVTCPACKQRLNPVIEGPGGSSAEASGGSAAPALPAGDAGGSGSGEPVRAAADATKRCPFCGEIILAIARKCKHCGEFLDRAAPPASPAFPPGATTTNASGSTTTGVMPGADVPAVYSLSVSQWDNFWKYLIVLFLFALVVGGVMLFKPAYEVAFAIVAGSFVIAGFLGWFFYLAAKNTRCYVRPTRIDTEEGILSKDLNSLELFRITDMELKQGFLERILGIGTVKLMTADSSSEPELVLYQIPRAREVFKYIQNQIPVAAKQRGAVYMES